MDFYELMTISSVLIIGIVLLRSLFLHVFPKKIFVLLWSVVLVRLMIPVHIPAFFSFYNLLGQAPPHLPAAAVPQAVGAGVDLLFVIWVCVAAVLLAIFLSMYISGIRRFSGAKQANYPLVLKWQEEKGRRVRIALSDRVSSPLTYGLFRPVILLPQNGTYGEEELFCILEHEMAHIKNHDLWRKLLFAVLLCLYWFHPLVWVMYFLVNRDMELASDERVLQQIDKRLHASYAKLLLDMSEKQSPANALMVQFSFGKRVMKERILSIM